MGWPFQGDGVTAVIERSGSDDILVKFEIMSDCNIGVEKIADEFSDHVAKIHPILVGHLLRNAMDTNGVGGNLPTAGLYDIGLGSYDFGTIGESPGNTYGFWPVIGGCSGWLVPIFRKTRGFCIEEEGAHFCLVPDL